MPNLLVIIFCGSWHVGYAKFSLGKAVKGELVAFTDASEEAAAAGETAGEATEAVALHPCIDWCSWEQASKNIGSSKR